MSAKAPPPASKPSGLERAVETKAQRKLREQIHGDRSLWFGIGMFGLIGWSVAIPTVLGALAGLWIDHHFPSPHSWTLALLVAGLCLGCVQAWRWVAKEEEKIRKQEKDNHD